jgi:hypothetical protein
MKKEKKNERKGNRINGGESIIMRKRENHFLGKG